MVRRRLDAELVRRGLAATDAEAREALRAGLVTVGGSPATNASSLVAPAEAVAVRSGRTPFVSRGGEKLAAALDRFHVDPTGRDALDAGASTGGFTDCLLQHGAARVIAVDVGYGDLAWSLRTDPRVTLLERTSVRGIDAELLPFTPNLVVADLSFTSLRLVLRDLVSVAAGDAELVVLVKPQFEAQREEVEPGGVVRDSRAWSRSIHGVAAEARDLGVTPSGVMPSPLRGPAGNVEFLLHLVRGRAKSDQDHLAVAAAIAEASGSGP